MTRRAFSCVRTPLWAVVASPSLIAAQLTSWCLGPPSDRMGTSRGPVGPERQRKVGRWRLRRRARSRRAGSWPKVYACAPVQPVRHGQFGEGVRKEKVRVPRSGSYSCVPWTAPNSSPTFAPLTSNRAIGSAHARMPGASPGSSSGKVRDGWSGSGPPSIARRSLHRWCGHRPDRGRDRCRGVLCHIGTRGGNDRCSGSTSPPLEAATPNPSAASPARRAWSFETGRGAGAQSSPPRSSPNCQVSARSRPSWPARHRETTPTHFSSMIASTGHDQVRRSCRRCPGIRSHRRRTKTALQVLYLKTEATEIVDLLRRTKFFLAGLGDGGSGTCFRPS